MLSDGATSGGERSQIGPVLAVDRRWYGYDEEGRLRELSSVGRQRKGRRRQARGAHLAGAVDACPQSGDAVVGDIETDNRKAASCQRRRDRQPHVTKSNHRKSFVERGRGSGISRGDGADLEIHSRP